jgi:hypothetical protein
MAEDVVEAVSGRSLKTEGDHARLKHRTVMDELHAAEVQTKDGTMEAPVDERPVHQRLAHCSCAATRSR